MNLSYMKKDHEFMRKRRAENNKQYYTNNKKNKKNSTVNDPILDLLKTRNVSPVATVPDISVSNNKDIMLHSYTDLRLNEFLLMSIKLRTFLKIN